MYVSSARISQRDASLALRHDLTQAQDYLFCEDSANYEESDPVLEKKMHMQFDPLRISRVV